MPAQETVYKIFIASPSGLNEERKAFADVIEEYNKSDAQHRGVSFRAVGWEDTLAGIGRPQEIINEELKECDFFLLLLHNRWGSNPGENKQNATSGTEEEFNLAMDCYNDENSHMKQIVCTFKSIDSQQLADPGKQLEKVLEFKKELEEEKKLLYTSFFSKQEFQTIIRKQLGRWLLNHENETKRNEKIQVESPIIPEVTIDAEVEKIISPTTKKDTTEIIKNAWKLANKGKLVEAEIEFSKAIIYSPNAYELLRYSSFLTQIGQLDKALMMLDRLLEDENITSEDKAVAYSHKGIIMKTRGDLDGASKMFKKSLEIEERLGQKEGVADAYGNLGNVMSLKGDIEGAVLLYKKVLEIEKQLRRKGSMASIYGNLGVLMKRQGNLDDAVLMYKKSLELYEQLAYKEGVAANYGNLGNVIYTLGDLDEAESKYEKSLELFKRLGNKKGIASQYGNLGNVMYSRGNLDDAKLFYEKSLELNKQMGIKEGMANQYGNLGGLMLKQANLDGAESMYKKSLEIAKTYGFAEIIRASTENLEILKEEKKKKNS